MKMNSIKFSEDYDKLPKDWEDSCALLIGVYPVSIEWLKKNNPAFIDYDTKFVNKDGTIGHYPLDFKDGLILVFIHDCGLPFTTIRRDYPQKRWYYQSEVGMPFVLRRAK